MSEATLREALQRMPHHTKWDVANNVVNASYKGDWIRWDDVLTAIALATPSAPHGYHAPNVNHIPDGLISKREVYRMVERMAGMQVPQTDYDCMGEPFIKPDAKPSEIYKHVLKGIKSLSASAPQEVAQDGINGKRWEHIANDVIDGGTFRRHMIPESRRELKERIVDALVAAAQAAQGVGTVSEEQVRRARYAELGLKHIPPYYEHVDDRTLTANLNALLHQPASAPAKETEDGRRSLAEKAKYEMTEFERTYSFGVIPCSTHTEIAKPIPGLTVAIPETAAPVVQPDAQVMERAREVVSNLHAAFHCSQCRRYEENELTKGIAALVTRERDAARMAALEQAAVIAERCVGWYEGRGDEVGKHAADEIRALAAKEQS